MANGPAYPFVPKSTAFLEPGHFWSIPLRNDGYAFGRVLQMMMESGKRNSRCFLAGLMDWHGPQPPTAEAIMGCGLIKQGSVHVMTIRENTGEILGFRELALDGIEPGLFKDASGAIYVQRGFEAIRRYNPSTDSGLPSSRHGGSASSNCWLKSTSESTRENSLTLLSSSGANIGDKTRRSGVAKPLSVHALWLRKVCKQFAASVFAL